jgi:hypothetical protein
MILDICHNRHGGYFTSDLTTSTGASISTSTTKDASWPMMTWLGTEFTCVPFVYFNLMTLVGMCMQNLGYMCLWQRTCRTLPWSRVSAEVRYLISGKLTGRNAPFLKMEDPSTRDPVKEFAMLHLYRGLRCSPCLMAELRIRL